MRYRYPLFIIVLLSFCGCIAEHQGSLLWESGVEQESYSEMRKGKLLLFPGVPLGGKAPENAFVMGIIDSGVVSTHPQLEGYVRAVKDFTGEGVEDTIGHGTAVALVALFGTGVKDPPLAIVSAKVADKKGEILENNVIKAIDWVVAQNAKVVNLSLGFKGTLQDHERLCNTIASHETVMFYAAAGNDGPQVPVFPASCNKGLIISVGASGPDGKPAGYSGSGKITGPGKVTFIKEWAYYYESAQQLARAGRVQEARLLYKKSAKTEPNAESEYQLGVIALNEDNVAAAKEHLKQAIQINPAIAEAHEMLGVSLHLQGEYRQAEKTLRKAIDLYPENELNIPNRARAYFNLGQTLMQLDRKQDAKTAFQMVKQLMPNYPKLDDALKLINE